MYFLSMSLATGLKVRVSKSDGDKIFPTDPDLPRDPTTSCKTNTSYSLPVQTCPETQKTSSTLILIIKPTRCTNFSNLFLE